MAKKKAEPKPRPEKYEKSNFIINGSFDDVISAAFAKDKKPKKKQNDIVDNVGD